MQLQLTYLKVLLSTPTSSSRNSYEGDGAYIWIAAVKENAGFFCIEQVVAGTLSASPAAAARSQPDSPCSPSTVKSFVLGEPGSEGMTHCSSMPLSQPNSSLIGVMFVQKMARIWYFDGYLVDGAGSQPNNSDPG